MRTFARPICKKTDCFLLRGRVLSGWQLPPHPHTIGAPNIFGMLVDVHHNTHTHSSVRQMPCPERVRLMDLYSKATRDMSEMVTALSDVAISYELDVFNRAWEHCECARRLCSDI